MLTTHLLRTLDLHAPSSPNRAPHLSAASGLVSVGEHWYVVADDEHHLGIFSSRHAGPGRLLRMFEGELPDRPKPRKAAKPDLEALVLLPRFPGYPSGALLALGSGSRPSRETAVLLGVDETGAIDRAPLRIDFAEFYAGLSQRLGKLNLEGAVVWGDRLRLLQRGNKSGVNAVIEMALQPLLQAMQAERAPRLDADFAIHTVELGAVDGIPLCFTDGAPLSNGDMLFTAVAEDTDDSYTDGACAGSAVGVLRLDGTLARMERLDCASKVEGVDVREAGDGLDLLLVTDGDNADLPAQLLSTRF